MIAIVEIAGQQFKVAKDQKVFVHRLNVEEGDSISFDNVLLVANGDQVVVGAPAIEGARVEAKVSRHLKGDKVIVFKKKRRKGYKKKNGHRQYLSEITIENIVAAGVEATQSAAKTQEVSSTGDDLKKIEGIGPKAAEALNAAGILTYQDLAGQQPEKIKEILVAASSRLSHLEPGSWPKQAQLAADGNWEELNKLQDELNGGK